MLAWRLIPILISVADGWQPQQQRQYRQQLIAQITEKPIFRNHDIEAYVDDIFDVPVTQRVTRRPGERPQERPLANFLPEYDDYYQAPHPRAENPIPASPPPPPPPQLRNQYIMTTLATFRPDLDAYLDDIFGLKNAPKLQRPNMEKVNKLMGLQQPQNDYAQEIHAYLENAYYEDRQIPLDDLQYKQPLNQKMKQRINQQMNQPKPLTRTPNFRAKSNLYDHLIKIEDADRNQQANQELSEESELVGIPGAGTDRGNHWYEDDSSKKASETEFADVSEDESMSLESREIKKSSGASSRTTSEKKIGRRAYRECTPCPLDMIRKHKNMGLKWICGGYQRSRRSFKSECMMRFRNCQDGTLYVKIYDRRCPDMDPFHGRSWFYIYNV